MDSRIPKPSSSIPQKKPAATNLFDFATIKKFDDIKNKKAENESKKPLNGKALCKLSDKFNLINSYFFTSLQRSATMYLGNLSLLAQNLRMFIDPIC